MLKRGGKAREAADVLENTDGVLHYCLLEAAAVTFYLG